MLKTYNTFILENKNKPIMSYYAFDWDDNILMMPTVIHMEHLINNKWVKEDVSTDIYAKIRNDKDWRLIYDIDYNIINDMIIKMENTESESKKMKLKNEIDNHCISFLEFRDFGPRGKNAFLEDTKKAIKNNNFGPSWYTFLKCLTQGSIFAIITARGHEPETIKKTVEYIINNILTQEQKDEMGSNLMAFKDMFISDFDILKNLNFEKLIKDYLNKCDFIGVSSKSFQNKYLGDASNPEIAKTIALNDFINKINNYGKQVNGDVRVGFSDDDPKNVNKIKKYFNEIIDSYDNISFAVIDTSNPNIVGGIKNKI